MIKIGLLEKAYVDEVCVVYVATDLYIYIYIYILLFKKGERNMLIPCVVIPHLQLPRKHVTEYRIVYKTRVMYD